MNGVNDILTTTSPSNIPLCFALTAIYFTNMSDQADPYHHISFKYSPMFCLNSNIFYKYVRPGRWHPAKSGNNVVPPKKKSKWLSFYFIFYVFICNKIKQNGRTQMCNTGDIYGGLRNNLGEVEKMGTLFLSLQKKKGWTTSVLQYYALHYMHLTKLEVLKTIPYCGFLRRVNLNLYNSLLQIVSIPIAPKKLLVFIFYVFICNIIKQTDGHICVSLVIYMGV